MCRVEEHVLSYDEGIRGQHYPTGYQTKRPLGGDDILKSF